MKADSVLKTIQKKNSLNKEDLSQILKLEGSEQQAIINKISKTRQKKLLEFLSQAPYPDDAFNFPLSRRESFQSSGPSYHKPEEEDRLPPSINISLNTQI